MTNKKQSFLTTSLAVSTLLFAGLACATTTSTSVSNNQTPNMPTTTMTLATPTQASVHQAENAQPVSSSTQPKQTKPSSVETQLDAIHKTAVPVTHNALPKTPLNQPSMSNTAVLVWANEATVTAFSYDFVNYRKELQQAADYFTAKGWESFKNALTKSGNLKTVIKNKLVVSAVATGAPVILHQGTINNYYTWRIQMPLLVSYQSATTDKKQHLIITMLVTRTQKFVGRRGLGILQFSATQKPGGQSDTAKNS